MIRFKDKIFEQYSICPAIGEIFDAKTGEVQKTYIYRGRPMFKKMGVHCIMAHTFYGYNSGMDIHHLDENPLNNTLSNLVYLTRSEHTSLHFKGKTTLNKGKPRSAETKAKISAAMKGKHFSEEHKAKLSAAKKGKPKSEETKAKMRAAASRRWSKEKSYK